MPEFYIIIARKIFSRFFGAGDGARPPFLPPPPSPTPMVTKVVSRNSEEAYLRHRRMRPRDRRRNLAGMDVGQRDLVR